MRLVDADEINWYDDGCDLCAFQQDIDKLPTIDAVEVVRCKDCKHRQELGWCPMYHLNYARYEWQLDDDCDDYTKDDGFCDRGEWGDDPSHPFADDVMMGEWKDDA